MRILVLGGTVFLSHSIALEAVARGHEVVCVARGASGSVPDGARLLVADRDSPGALDELRDERFDAVVDVAAMSLPWVAHALEVLASRAAHWTFVSTLNVYADVLTRGQGVDAPLLPPRTELTERSDSPDPDIYGAVKVASENVVREAMGARAFVVRAGLLAGPGDPHDRFGYWPARMARGGRVVVPDAPDQPFQYVDARDLAAWIVSAAQRGLAGTFDASGPRGTLNEVLDGIASAVGAPDLKLVPVPPDQLLAAGVTPWAGPKSLPLWLPETHYGMADRDTAPALAAGLSPRPLRATAEAALDYERSLGVDRPRKAGLTLLEEAELLRQVG
jgi:2'-hydroxyisoflavone reductase